MIDYIIEKIKRKKCWSPMLFWMLILLSALSVITVVLFPLAIVMWSAYLAFTPEKDLPIEEEIRSEPSSAMTASNSTLTWLTMGTFGGVALALPAVVLGIILVVYGKKLG